MKSSLSITVGLVAICAVCSPAFGSTGSGVQTNPDANSPPGVVYQIPLDAARVDAAPHVRVGSGLSAPGGDTGGNGLNASSIESENGLGSSARIPGLAQVGGLGAASVPGGNTAKAGRTTVIDSFQRASAQATDAGVIPAYLVIVALVAIGAWAGVRSSRALRL